ncbi:MAG: secretion protein XcpP [Gammaproteobacteria bacterium]|nr:secretion protein XcpP [Gammaproteobacteria bacterium]MBU0882997.1 secretion protein XcpP [Gammaproteobacteria bacterium]MBU1859302.1 secretion protein XcpP [Gammaproteobacteria bacterium]
MISAQATPHNNKFGVTPLPLLGSHPWLQRHAITVVSFVLVAAMSISLAWQTAEWARLLRAPVAASNSTATLVATALPAEIGQLFGSDVANDQLAPDTNLRLTLLGSFVHADPQRSSAIIRSEGSVAQRYSVDSEISSGVRLHAVAADHVELMRNGRRESLRFPLHHSAADNQQNYTPEVMADPVEQLNDLQDDNLSQLRERMEALRQQMQDSGSLPAPADPTEQPTENN